MNFDSFGNAQYPGYQFDGFKGWTPVSGGGAPDQAQMQPQAQQQGGGMDPFSALLSLFGGDPVAAGAAMNDTAKQLQQGQQAQQGQQPMHPPMAGMPAYSGPPVEQAQVPMPPRRPPQEAMVPAAAAPAAMPQVSFTPPQASGRYPIAPVGDILSRSRLAGR